MKLLIAVVGLVVLLTVGPQPGATGAPSDDPVLVDVRKETGATYLARLNADGSGFRRVTRPNHQYVASTLSPNRRLLMMYSTPGVVIDLATPAGADRRRLFTASENQGSFHPVWSPDSSQLLVTADRGAGQEFLVVPIDGAEPVLVGDAVDVPALNVAPFAWSPDGSVGVFKGVRYDDEGLEHAVFFRVRRDGDGLRELAGWTAYAARPVGGRASRSSRPTAGPTSSWSVLAWASSAHSCR